MSGISNVTASGGTLGDVAPISFPGISSGIDYNSIIDKLTSVTLKQNKPLQDQLTHITAQNTELLKIKHLVESLQDAIGALADKALFDQYDTTSSNPSAGVATQVSGGVPNPGTVTILSQSLATATSITGDPAANAAVTPATQLGSGVFQIAPKYGASSQGSLTVNGTPIVYSATTTVQDIVDALNAISGVTATFAGNALSITSTGPVTVGSASDTGNLASVLKLDTAQITNGGKTIASSSGVGGFSLTTPLAAYGITGSNFTINGVSIAVNAATDSLTDVFKRINNAGTGVNATLDPATGSIRIVNKATGPQSIVLGAPGDSSNLLQTLGLKAGGFTPVVLTGSQAQVTFLNPSGSPQTVYSASNALTNVIPGVSLALSANTAVPYTVTIAASTSKLTDAIGTFVTTYNAVIDEFNSATAPPVVQGTTPGTGIIPGKAQSTQLTTGGVLYGNFSVEQIKNKLVNLTTSLFQNGSSRYNSLSTIGLRLDNSVTVLTSKTTSGSDNSTDSSPLSTTTYGGTSGRFQKLDASKLSAAILADPTAVKNMFVGAISLPLKVGAYLSYITGSPTQLGPRGAFASQVPSISLLQGIENSNTNRIRSVNSHMKLVTDKATQQANSLRRQFNASEAVIARLQAEQQSLAGFLNQNSSNK